MRARRITRWVTTAGASAVLLAGTSALPAHAAQGFTLSTPSKSIGDGSTNATGSVSFNGKYSFDISSTVWDSCPADGDGAYLALGVEFVDGTGFFYSYGSAFNQDANGCDNGKESNSITRNYSKRVKRVKVTLFEADASGGGVKETANSAWKDNPYTG